MGAAVCCVHKVYNGDMDWNLRYTQQARWTAQMRSYLFNKAGLAAAERVLDLGCGTGSLLADLPVKSGAAVNGLDLNLSSVKQARAHNPRASLLCADGVSLPYADSCFDVVFCHFVLLWTSDPLKVVAEMRRVTRSAGAVLALAEPDYGGRVDYPMELAALGRWQAESLWRQGADPEMGRKLASIFIRAGLKYIETGVIGGEWTSQPTLEEREIEWDVLASDLAGQVPLQDLQKIKQQDEAAWARGERILYVPTFYAWGVV
jgi:ubiquinone/menaquinone biosynthesis C-methylase UbiE